MQENELIDLTDIFDRLFKAVKKHYKLCLCIIIACVILLEAKILISYDATYTSSMTVIVSQEYSDILISNESTETTNKAFQQALTSSTMQKIIKQDLGLDNVPASVRTSLVPDTNFLVVSATSSSPQNAYDVVKSIESNYGQVTKLMNDASIILIQEAKLPVFPDSSPQYLKQATIGVIFGTVISIGFIVIYALTRRTINKESYIKDRLHLKSLGTIPEITLKRSSYQNRRELLVTDKRIPLFFKESFRTLTLAINRKKDSKVFMITSTLPNEGKSTISSNVALMLALEGKKVVLLDFDLRNPSLYKIFKLNNPKEQIGDYLDGNCKLEDILTNSEIDQNLDLILGSISYDNSIELLKREKTEKLIEELKTRYDYVIVDVPPILLMQDALSVVKFTDSTILVIKQDYAKIYDVIEALDELYEIDGNIMGCVLNGVQKSLFDEDSKGYGYGYGYGREK